MVNYLERGTNTVLKEQKTANAYYGAYVTETAEDISLDLDGDGINEDFQLYEANRDPQSITIGTGGNVINFYYVRCEGQFELTKQMENSAEKGPYNFHIRIHSKSGFHKSAYDYKIFTKDTNEDGEQLESVVSSGTGDTGLVPVGAPKLDANGDPIVNDGQVEIDYYYLSVDLEAGQTIRIDGLPTAVYTITEQELPTGYYQRFSADTNGDDTTGEVTITKDSKVSVTCTNTYDPANLSIKKTVNVVEVGTNTPEVEEFEFTVTFPAGVTPAESYRYKVNDVEAAQPMEVQNGQLVINIKNGQTVEFINLPLGAYTVTEKDYKAEGYDSSYKVSNAADFVEGLTAPVTLERGKTSAVEFQNEFPVGDIVIEKTVNKEFYGTAWDGGDFTFTVQRTSKALIKDNAYKVWLDGVEQPNAIVVDDEGKLTVTISFSKSDAAKLNAPDSSQKHAVTIKNLPAGTYEVTEAANAAFMQSAAVVSSLVLPGATQQAAFTNTLKRPAGDLSLAKELVPAPGFNPEELPIDTEFKFEVVLLEGVPTEDKEIDITYYSGDTATPTTVTMKNGKFTVALKAGMSVFMDDLPEGRYRIMEETVPYYANDFAIKQDSQWIAQPETSTVDGRMYTDVVVSEDAPVVLKCTNVYPVDRAELILQKLVTTECDQDSVPAGLKFTYTITMAEADLDKYSYTIYNEDGSVAESGEVTAVEKKEFTISLGADQYVVIPGMPACEVTVTETVNTADYNCSYVVYESDSGETPSTTVNKSGTPAVGSGNTFTRTLAANNTYTVIFTNEIIRKVGDLTITNTVEGNLYNADDTFVYTITGPNGYRKEVAINGSGSVTLKDLPRGAYTVTQDTDWSWRYHCSQPVKTVDVGGEDGDATADFTNTLSKYQWLSDMAYALNAFPKT